MNRARTFLIAAVTCLAAFPVNAAEQLKDNWASARFPNGVTLTFTSHKEPDTAPVYPSGHVEIRANEDVVHRVFVDADAAVYFGYDVRVEPIAERKQIKLTFVPLSSPLVTPGTRTLLRPLKSITRFPEPQLVRDGDTISLDVLVNPRTGIKIVDNIKAQLFTEHPFKSRLGGAEKALPPRDFTADSVKLTMTDARLIIDGRSVDDSARFDVAGPLIWFALPNHDRFVVSLTDRGSSGFKKIGVVAYNAISFVFGGKTYEWVSSDPIMRDSDGSWNLWVLHDSNFTMDQPFRSYIVGATDRPEHLFSKD